MPSSLPFSEDCRDVLQEISNVAMGVAGESLALLTDSFVQLSIPCIRRLATDQLAETLGNLPADALVSAIGGEQSVGNIGFYALVAVTDASFADLGVQMGRSTTTDDEQAELLRDIASTLIDTCVPELETILEGGAAKDNALSSTLESLAMHTPVAGFRIPSLKSTQGLLSVEINYHLEAHAFNCDLVLLFPAQAISELSEKLERLLE